MPDPNDKRYGSFVYQLPRAPKNSTWELDYNLILAITEEITLQGWDASMEVVEMAMLSAENIILSKIKE